MLALISYRCHILDRCLGTRSFVIQFTRYVMMQALHKCVCEKLFVNVYVIMSLAKKLNLQPVIYELETVILHQHTAFYIQHHKVLLCILNAD